MRVQGRRFLSKYGFGLLLFIGLSSFFLIVGRGGAVMFDDSGSYMRLRWQEGIMPVYQVFLLMNQWMFGDKYYLWAVILEQAFLAVIAIMLLEETIRRQFDLRPIEGILICIPALYPYTIEMPMAVMTQAVLTEGISYSLFYLFLILLLKTVWRKKYGWFCGVFCMTLFLSAVRPQFQMLFGVCGIVFLYLVYMRGKEKKRRRILVCLLLGIAGCLAVSLSGLILVSGMIKGYRAMMQNDHPFYQFGLQVQKPEEYQRLQEEKQRQLEPVEVTETAEGLHGEEEERALVDKGYGGSQYVTLIFSRGMYEADYEDATLFEDPVIRGLYLTLYEATDAEKLRYVYAGDGLWMWKDIVGGIGKLGTVCDPLPSKYYVQNAPEIIKSAQYSDIRLSHLCEIGMTLIRAHFMRFLYHTLAMLPQAFISTVFFQFAPLYTLCHLITAFLYLSALALMIWGYRDTHARKEAAEMMALVLGTNVVTVVAISLVFFGQQRYLVYTFGPFYIALYLLLRQLWKVRVREALRDKIGTGRKNPEK